MCDAVTCFPRTQGEILLLLLNGKEIKSRSEEETLQIFAFCFEDGILKETLFFFQLLYKWRWSWSSTAIAFNPKMLFFFTKSSLRYCVSLPHSSCLVEKPLMSSLVEHLQSISALQPPSSNHGNSQSSTLFTAFPLNQRIGGLSMSF